MNPLKWLRRENHDLSMEEKINTVADRLFYKAYAGEDIPDSVAKRAYEATKQMARDYFKKHPDDWPADASTYFGIDPKTYSEAKDFRKTYNKGE